MADDRLTARWEALSLGYPAYNSGSYDLREAIGAQYASLSADAVNVCAPQEGIYLAMRALLEPGDAVVATTPCYQSLTEIARSTGCEVLDWEPTLPSATTPSAAPHAHFEVERLRALLEARPGGVRLVVANWPHNPTGALPTPSELEAVMYRGLEHNGVPSLPAAVDAYPERGVSLAGLSKAYGLPGLRIGWLACRDATFGARVSLLKDYTTICPATPSEALGLIALANADAITSASRARAAVGLDAVRAFVAQHSQHFEWLEPLGTTCSFPSLRAGGSAEAYATALRARARLMLIPSPLFSFGDERVRITYGREHTAPLLERWRADLAEHGVSCG